VQDINTTPKELKTERDCSHRQLFHPFWGSSVWRNNQRKLILFEPRTEEMCKEDPFYTVSWQAWISQAFHNCMSCDLNCEVLPCYIYASVNYSSCAHFLSSKGVICLFFLFGCFSKEIANSLALFPNIFCHFLWYIFYCGILERSLTEKRQITIF